MSQNWKTDGGFRPFTKLRTRKFTWLHVVLMLTVVSVLALGPWMALRIRAASCTNSLMDTMAHEDDEFLFMNPDLLHAIQGGTCVRSVYVTAGDAGQGQSFWQGRANGVLAADAEMAGVSNSWTQSDAGISGHPMPLYTLNGNPNISVVFMRLPDGNVDGSGFPSTGNVSLQQLWTSAISSMTAVDGTSSYTASGLTNTLLKLMQSFQPTQIHTQDFVGGFGDGDHSDHHAVAYFTEAAHKQYTTTHVLTGYEDYGISNLPSNLSSADTTAKQNAFLAYAPFDSGVCQSASACAGTSIGGWFSRQYIVGTESGGTNQSPVANAGANQSVASGATVQLNGSGSADADGDTLTYQWAQIGGPAVTLSGTTAVQPTFTAPAGPVTLTFWLVVNDGHGNTRTGSVTVTVAAPNSLTNLALSATATCSSQNTSTQQTCNKAIDGVVDGYPGDYTREWATVGGGAGSWLKLTWSSSVTLNYIVLFDRPNGNDQITAATLTFSDGSSTSFGALPNNDSPVTINLPSPVTTTSVLLTITAVSSSTVNVGLAEIQCWGTSGGTGGNQPPVANAGANQSVASGATVQLNGSGSADADGDTLTYQWAQTGGAAVTLSSTTAVQPIFLAPTGPATLTFQLVVNDGHGNTSSASVTITVSAPASTNVALSATATCSSQNTSTQQTCNKAIDGVVDGWPGDYTREWATVGGGAGSWLKLTWSSSVTLNYIVLFDRPNGNDQITAGTLTFSDGTTVSVPALPNNDSPVTINLPSPKTTTSVLLTITAVSSSTVNVGLAEIQCWGH